MDRWIWELVALGQVSYGAGKLIDRWAIGLVVSWTGEIR
jgi:hypothetical protein